MSPTNDERPTTTDDDRPPTTDHPTPNTQHPSHKFPRVEHAARITRDGESVGRVDAEEHLFRVEAGPVVNADAMPVTDGTAVRDDQA